MNENKVNQEKWKNMRGIVFWVMFGFFSGVLFISSTMVNYERPYKWEDGGIITHQGKAYKLQEVSLSLEKK
jgi:hypothetical protein